jgi:hypothetical protein
MHQNNCMPPKGGDPNPVLRCPDTVRRGFFPYERRDVCVVSAVSARETELAD